MNYRMTQEFRPPFRINALIEEAGSLKVIPTFHYSFLSLMYVCISLSLAVTSRITLLKLLLQAEVILKISAEFASSVTANTIKLQMPLPKCTSRCYSIFLSVV